MDDVLFLSAQLLFDLPPGADLQPAADPTQTLGRLPGRIRAQLERRFRAAHNAASGFFQPIVHDRSLSLFQDFGCNHRLRFGRSFAHLAGPPSLFTMAETTERHKSRESAGSDSCRLRELHDHRRVQAGGAARALLARSHHRLPSASNHLPLHIPRADGAIENSPRLVIHHYCCHRFVLLTRFKGRWISPKGSANFCGPMPGPAGEPGAHTDPRARRTALVEIQDSKVVRCAPCGGAHPWSWRTIRYSTLPRTVPATGRTAPYASTAVRFGLGIASPRIDPPPSLT